MRTSFITCHQGGLGLFTLAHLWLATMLTGSLAISHPARGETVVLTTPVSIAVGQTTYDGKDLVISNCVVSVDGAHSYNSVAIIAGGSLTHPACTSTETHSLDLSVATELRIDGASTVDTTGKGYLPGRTVGNQTSGAATGNAGGSYGGYGGNGYYVGRGGVVYGDYHNPNEPGSGAAQGGVGGGLIRISAGSVVNDGSLRANGTAGGWNASGGSGGGIWIKTGTLSGAGTITANGGGGEVDGGSGGGGRIAILHTATTQFDWSRVTAYGGGVGRSQAGATGTIYTKQADQPASLRLVKEASGPAGAWTPLGLASETEFRVDHLVISGTNLVVAPEHEMPLYANRITLLTGATLTCLPSTADNEYSLVLFVTNALAVDESSKIDVSGRGYLSDRTLSNRTEGASTGRAGGSYGGLGGSGYYVGGGNRVYGDYRNPNNLGSGGGGGGGSGGGLVRVSAGTLELDGLILANGVGAGWNLSGGSGGGIWVQVGSLSGNGGIRANGGTGDTDGGSGGGGRIAILHTAASQFDWSRVTAYGGRVGRSQAGAAGTIYIKQADQPASLRLVEEGTGTAAAWTPLGLASDVDFRVDHLVVSGTNMIVAPDHDMPLYANRISLLNGATLSCLPSTADKEHRLEVFVAETLTVDSSSRIDVTARGYLPGRTVGNSTEGASTGNSGGSYGGLGGGGYWGGGVNRVYGDYHNPNNLGSGGGSGGIGGGLVRVSAGTLDLDGLIVADGVAGGHNASGGSGGGIWVQTRTVSGAGSIRANGGAGDTDGGSGSGGRIAFYYDINEGFDLTQILALGGDVGRSGFGGAGTVYLKSGASEGLLRVWDGGKGYKPGWTALGTPEESVFEAENVVITGTNVAVISEHSMPIQANSFSVLDGALLTHLPATASREYSLSLAVTNTFLVDTNSRVDVSGLGYLPGRTVGNQISGAANGNAGGSYGGYGGDGYYSGHGNAVYGDYHNPNELGSGAAQAGIGGGLVRIAAANAVIDGRIAANGSSGGGNQSGGSGGGIWLAAASLKGSGKVSANGGGASVDGGSGGGGRIAIYYNNASEFNFDKVAALPGWVERSGAGGVGTVYLRQNDQEGVLLLSDHDQGSKPGLTPLGLGTDSAFNAEKLVINGTNVAVIPEHPMPVRVNRLWILNGALVTHPTTTTEREYNLDLLVTNDLVLDAASMINVSGRGYRVGRTFGNTTVGASTGNAGGSYGGRGGTGYYGGTGNEPYGDYRNPRELGSGASQGGVGGGLVRVAAGTGTIDGAILADGVGGGWNQSGGSGGGILLDIVNLVGSGTVRARGGAGDLDGGSGSGGRIAVYCVGDNAFNIANITADGGVVGRSTKGQTGTVFVATSPQCFWEDPFPKLAHGITTLKWAAHGIGTVGISARIVAFGNGASRVLADQRESVGSLSWDTTTVADGQYELKVFFRDESQRLLGEASRVLSVNNAAIWHSGTVAANETWSPDAVHFVEGSLVISSNAVVTVTPGAVVKAIPGAAIRIQNGGILVARGTSSLPILFTSLADDLAGGDSTFDGKNSMPQPGDWFGVNAETGGTFDLTEYTELRYARLEHTGTLAASETWMGSYLHRVVGSVIVPDGVLLTIQAGAVIKLDPTAEIQVQSGGQLTANGLPGMKIIFTSVRDDSVGGDSNGDGEQTTPAAGDWHWVLVNGGRAEFNHAELRFGGGPSEGGWGPSGGPGKAAIKTYGGAFLTVSNSVIADAFYDGILAWGGSVTVANSVLVGIDRAICAHPGSQVRVINCTLDDNRVSLLIHGGSMEVANTIAANSATAGILHDYGPDLLTVRSTDIWPDITSGTANWQAGANGNISADPKFRDLARRNYRLNYASSCIDAGDGSQAPVSDLMGAPRYDDPRSPNTGTVTSSGAYADMGAYEFVETADSDIDLVVDRVEGPSGVTAGEFVTLRWGVVNLGSARASGPWHDKVALVADQPTRGVLRIEITNALSQVNLDPGGRTTGEVTVRVPGGTEGSWRWQVTANGLGEVFEGRNWTNNVSPVPPPVSLHIPELAVGSTVTGAFWNVSTPSCYKFQQPPGADVFVAFNSVAAQGRVRLYAGFDSMPTESSFDLRSADWNQVDVRMGIPGPEVSRVVYLLFVPESLASDQLGFSVTTSVSAFGITSLGLSVGGNAGNVTVPLVGSGIRDSLTVQLRAASGGTPLSATRIEGQNTANAMATFNLRGAPVGLYHLIAAQDGLSSVLSNAFRIQIGTGGRFNSTLTLPSQVRVGRAFQALLTFANEGDADLPLPLIAVQNSANGPMWTGAKDAETSETQLQFLAFSDDPKAVILRPGEQQSMKFYSKVLINGSVSYFVTWYEGASTTPMDWDVVKTAFKPADADALWDQAWSALVSTIGSTVGNYITALATAAVELPRSPSQPPTPGALLWYLLEQQKVQLPGASFFGVVYEDNINNPLADVMVVLQSSQDGQQYGTTPLSDGTFAFRALPPGEYSVRVDGYFPDPIGVVNLPGAASVPLVVSKGARIVGRLVSAADNSPVADAVASAFDQVHQRVHIGQTDSEGYYEIQGLPASQYRLEITADMFLSPAAETLTIGEGETATASYSLEAGGTIEGKVFSSSGNVITGAQVRAFSTNGLPGKTTTSGAGGAFRLSGLSEGVYRVIASATGNGTGTTLDLRVLNQQATSGVVVTLSQAARLALKLTDAATGQPIENGAISLDEPSTTSDLLLTDAQGLLTIQGVSPGTHALYASASGYQPAQLTADATLTAQSPTVLKLSQLGSISGVVLRGSASPVVGTEITLLSTNLGFASATTDAQGRFTFTGLPNAAYELAVVKAQGLPSARTHVVLDSATNSYEVKFELPGTEIRGRVYLAGGTSPVADVQVQVIRDERPLAVTRTDAQGRYAFLVFAEGPVDIVANGLSIGMPALHNVTLPAGGLVEGVDLTGGATRASIEVRKETSTGLLMTNATVLLRPAGGQPESVWLMGRTDASGSASFSNLTTEAYQVEVSAPGYARQQQTWEVATADAKLAVLLQPAATLQGQLLDSDGNPAYPAWLLVVDPSLPTAAAGAETEPDGSYTISTVGPGSYELWMGGSTYAPFGAKNVALLSGVTTVRNATLSQSGVVLSGIVLDAAGQALTGARVELATSSGVPLLTTLSDADGSYAFKAVSSGGYLLRALAAGTLASAVAIQVADAPVQQLFKLEQFGAMALATSAGSGAGLMSMGVSTPGLAGNVSLASSDPDSISDWWTLLSRPWRARRNVIAANPEDYTDTDAWRVSYTQYSPVDASCPAYQDALNQARRSAKQVKNSFDAWVDQYEALKNLNKEILLSPSQLGFASAKAYLFIQTLGASAELKLASSSLVLAQETAVAIYRSMNEKDYKKMEYFQRQMIKQMANAYKELGGTPLIGQANSLWRLFWDFKDAVDYLGDAYQDYKRITTAKYEELKFAYQAAVYAHENAIMHVKLAAKQDCRDKKKCKDPTKPCPPPPPGPKPGPKTDADAKGSIDPNDKQTIGYGRENYVSAGTRLVYLIRFENKSTASAPAQEVFVTDQLDKNLDWSTLELLSVGFNNIDLPVPPGLDHFTTNTVVATDPNNDVDVHAALDPDTGVITWTMTSIDPLTQDLPEDPLAGFLPPNDAQHRGEGYVSYSVQTRGDLVSGTLITNMARIVFDVNPPIDTPPVTNRIDALMPASQVMALPANSGKTITVAWQGYEETGGSGLASYDLYVSLNGAAYTCWLSGTTNTSAIIDTEPSTTYRMFTVARDHAGNVEAAPSTADATTWVGFAMTQVVPGPAPLSEVRLHWESRAGGIYAVWWSEDCVHFSKVASDLQGTPPENVYAHPVTGKNCGFYRIELTNP